MSSTFPNHQNDGTPPFVLELCRRLSGEFELTVIAPDAPAAQAGDWDGFTVLRFRYAPRDWQQLTGVGGIVGGLRAAPWRLLLVPLFLAGQAWALWRSRKRFDLIHAHWLFPQGLIAVLFGGGVPVVCTSHGADVLALKGAAWTAVRRFVARRSTALTAVSAPLEQSLASLAPSTPIHRLPMGVDLDGRFQPLPGNIGSPPALLFVGRLVPKKGVDLLLRAFADLRRQHTALSLQIIGDGPERGRLQQLANQLCLGSEVEFSGNFANSRLPAAYQSAQVVVLPFRVAADGDAEGFSVTLLEALACGCRVVYGDVSTQASVLGPLPGVWCVAPDDPARLAAAIDAAIRSGLEPKQLRAGREAVLSMFSWSSVGGAYAAVLRQASKKGATR